MPRIPEASVIFSDEFENLAAQEVAILMRILDGFPEPTPSRELLKLLITHNNPDPNNNNLEVVISRTNIRLASLSTALKIVKVTNYGYLLTHDEIKMPWWTYLSPNELFFLNEIIKADGNVTYDELQRLYNPNSVNEPTLKAKNIAYATISRLRTKLRSMGIRFKTSGHPVSSFELQLTPKFYLSKEEIRSTVASVVATMQLSQKSEKQPE